MRKIKITKKGLVDCFSVYKNKSECVNCPHCFGMNNFSRFVLCSKVGERDHDE